MPLLDKSMINTISTALENTINAALAMDPKSQRKLSSLEGCVLEVRLRNPEMSIFFVSEEGKLCVLYSHAQPTVVLSGSILAFIKLAALDDTSLLFKTRELELCGDAVRAQQIQMFVKAVNIDWEALLAEVIGDVPAHFIGTTFKTGLDWSRAVGANFLRDAEEFVKYELSLFPSKEQGSKQFDAIDQIRLATDRLEARMRKLMQRGEKV